MNKPHMSTDKHFKGVEVEWKSLGEVTLFSNGKGHEKDITDGGKYIVVNSKFISTDGTVAKFSNKQICPLFTDDILIVMSDLPNGKALAKTFIVDMNERYTLNQRIGAISVKDKTKLLPMFLYYFLNRTPQLTKYDNGTDQTNLRKDQILDINIPIPPLKVQAEIVRILNTFTELTTKLTTELTTEFTARKKQYNYYRDQLLTFEDGDVEWKTLGEISKFTYGHVAKAQDSGNARFVRISDIDANGKLLPCDAKYVDISTDNKKFILKKNDLLMARTGATYGKTMLFEENYTAIFAGFLIKLDFDKNILNPKYYWHFAQSDFFWYQAKKLVSGGGQPQFNANVLQEIKIAIPPLAEQDRIITILDKFDALVGSITEGLPREIELHQKQYEYYRELLLSFPKVEV